MREQQRRGRLPRGLLERLETRHLLATLAGTPFVLNEILDASELAGTLSATIDWGDGVVTAGNVSLGGGGTLVGRVDYSLDSNNFFDTQLKKDLFQQAVDTIMSQLGDDLAAIVPSAGNTWTAEFFHPGTGAAESVRDLNIPANEIVIYAGGRELGDSLAVGGPGAVNASCIDITFCNAASTRGELGAAGPLPTDFGPWGGAISFDITTDYHFSQSTDDLGARQSDFLSVAMHEVAHLLGFGSSSAWQTYVVNGVFTGPASRAANGGQGVLLSSGGGHWANETMSNGREAAMDPSLTTGTRKLLTPLDFAGLDDVGWEFVPLTATVTGSHTYDQHGVYDVIVTLEGNSGGMMITTFQETVTSVPGTLTVEVMADQIADMGATLATVTRSDTDIDDALEVSISIDDLTRAAAPDSVVIPAGQSATTFPIDAIDNGLDDGIQWVTVTVAASGYEAAVDTLLVGDAMPWHNSELPWDVDGDAHVSPIDVLRIINDLNARGSRRLSAADFTGASPYLDVDGDGYVSPLDALLVVNYLNS